ncbi:ImmA/IrrE family metallo-endopeptidase [Fusibacter ferrireducens]|uniref:ImmA/IrrE family metallo-endopeptidase n=1 Tax=Fusibacter ferrireducens TaxID=2785058 RepID=A0ABR9ZUZ2_9FIRM|nr:ImmA/IrrE family metallo-endopeptidase [Fusibacter ferrireducens]MBF4693978.1 ImmA/IrrE family metallo-endopeptidase [Fusibacter ferrireducens]
MTKLLDIITTLGIHIEYRPDPPSKIRGFYYKDLGDEIIVMNEDIKDETEFRHVLAHELGHYFTTITTKSLSPYSSYLDILNTHRNESRAIRWACDYLIPTYDLLGYLKSQKGVSIADIALAFKVTEEMITMKFTIMSLERLYWKVDDKRSLVLTSLPSIYMYTPL